MALSGENVATVVSHIESGVAEDSPMQEVLDVAQAFAQTGETLLITGPTGTGKGELAKFIHAHSSRVDH